MRYYRNNEEEFVSNGKSTIRVSCLNHFKRPASPGRIIKVFTVIGPVKQSPSNQIGRGAIICLSFPEMEVNSKDYKWKRGEETQIKMRLQLHKTKGPLLHDEASAANIDPIHVRD